MLVHCAISRERLDDASSPCLTVDFRRRAYANGEIERNHKRREHHGSDEEMFIATIVERSIRPFFPVDYASALSLTLTEHSSDGMVDPVVVCINTASCSLLASSQPWGESVSGSEFNDRTRIPPGCVRVAVVDGELCLNPTLVDQSRAELNMLYVGTLYGPLLVQMSGDEQNQKVISEALAMAHAAIPEVIENQLDFMRFLQSEKSGLVTSTSSSDVAKVQPVKRDDILIRLLSCEAGVFPSLHGSSLVSGSTAGTAGSHDKDVDSLCVTTLGSLIGGASPNRFSFQADENRKDTFFVECQVDGRESSSSWLGIMDSKFIERSFSPVLPTNSAFPFAISLFSESFSKSGGFSAAPTSVAAATLSLTEAGVPISKPVGCGALDHAEAHLKLARTADGITAFHAEVVFPSCLTLAEFGLLCEKTDEEALNSLDLIQKAVSAYKQSPSDSNQSTTPTINELLESYRREDMHSRVQAERLHALGKLWRQTRALRLSSGLGPESGGLKKFSPGAALLKFDPEYTGSLLGPGAQTRDFIESTYGVTITVEDCFTSSPVTETIQTEGANVDILPDVAVCYIYGSTPEACACACELIVDIVHPPEKGEIFLAEVDQVFDFGAVVKLTPFFNAVLNLENLIWGPKPDKSMQASNLVTVGQRIEVQVIDTSYGWINVSRVAVHFDEDSRAQAQHKEDPLRAMPPTAAIVSERMVVLPEFHSTHSPLLTSELEQ
jgi:ribonuclease PH